MMKMRKEIRVRYAMQRFDQAKGRGQWDFTDGESTMDLISDTWSNGPHDIKLIFLGGRPITVACYWGLCASPMRCTIARAWRTPPKPS
ncbi:hypothetical protein I3843_08G018700 [Carya illinoinensis]|uniref:Uncharacterized protein n=1 Tax=Carya illinoinensis TaxID=32201 RepID=A0A8T1PP20_CARIL|nr:hypothetical protein CIPAW_08G017600 [Carya illinoinensis]KAG7965803.1 hypothetical protein I3843_08G018700 [Carya illinoinensis]